jgi:hypothetical protein
MNRAAGVRLVGNPTRTCTASVHSAGSCKYRPGVLRGMGRLTPQTPVVDTYSVLRKGRAGCRWTFRIRVTYAEKANLAIKPLNLSAVSQETL